MAIGRIAFLSLVLAAPLAVSAPPGGAGPVEATSLLGQPLERPALEPDVRERLDANLAQARSAFEQDPASEEARIWYARRLGYLGHYRDAIDVLTEGLEQNPWSFRLLRHRGHRWITLREFDKAIADLEQADKLFQTRDEIEPDGAPNRIDVPRSTLRFNILYHLALARYLKGDLEGAREAWERCLIPALRNDDMLIATTNWLVLTCRRLGREDEARLLLDRITPDLNIVEEKAYLTLCLLHKGEVTEKEALEAAGGEENASLPGVTNATILYGVGAWRMVEGRDGEARDLFNRICSTTDGWAAFGHIAAEAEVARLMKVQGSAPAR